MEQVKDNIQGLFEKNVFDTAVVAEFGTNRICSATRGAANGSFLGYLLGPLVEGNLRQLVEMQGHAWDMVTRPISATFLVASAGFLAFSLYKHHKRGATVPPNEAKRTAP